MLLVSSPALAPCFPVVRSETPTRFKDTHKNSCSLAPHGWKTCSFQQHPHDVMRFHPACLTTPLIQQHNHPSHHTIMLVPYLPFHVLRNERRSALPSHAYARLGVASSWEDFYHV